MIASVPNLFLLGVSSLAAIAAVEASLRGSVSITHTTKSFADTHGNMVRDWDARCPSQADDLEHCVGLTGGYAEICKGCAKMASNLASNDLALKGCAEDRYMCNGCNNDLMAYYNCGTTGQHVVTATEENLPLIEETHASEEANIQPETTITAQTQAFDNRNNQGYLDHQPESSTVHSSQDDTQVHPHHIHHIHEAETTASTNPMVDVQNVEHTHHIHDEAETESSSTNPTANSGSQGAHNDDDHDTAAGIGPVETVHDWDVACPAHAYDLGNCVANAGGNPRLCKPCIQMASSLQHSEEVLDACATEPAMCGGGSGTCRTTIRGYYECGLRHNNSNNNNDAAAAASKPDGGIQLDPHHLNDPTDANLDGLSNNDRDDDDDESASPMIRPTGLTDDWDEVCSTQADDLGHCVSNAGGILELCKACAKMASTLKSSEFALDECAEEPTMCHGCRTALNGYYDCGAGFDNNGTTGP